MTTKIAARQARRSRFAHSVFPPFSRHLLQLVAAASVAGFSSPTVAGPSSPVLPTGGTVVSGNASIGAPSNGTLTVTQSSDKAIVNWQGFSIGQGGTVNIDNGSGATLNRVTGSDTSEIDGNLNATGSVYLINTMAVSDYLPLPGNVHFDLEAKRDERATFFGTVKVVNAAIEVYQAAAGWSDAWGGAGEYGFFDATLHWSPGGLDGANTTSAFALFTAGLPHGRANYLYGTMTFAHRVALPFGLALLDQINAQAASAALPETEQGGIGGTSLVRGYTLDDGAFDSTLVTRNELRGPSIGVISNFYPVSDVLSPYIFADAGHGNARASHFSADAASVGIGADYGFGSWFSAGVDGAYALNRALFTHDGDWRLESRISATW